MRVVLFYKGFPLKKPKLLVKKLSKAYNNVHKTGITVYLFRVGGGTTWHSSGLIGVFKPSLSQVRLTQSSVALYEELESRGLSTGWKQCGSLNVARTVDRMIVFRRMKAQSM